MWIYCGFCSHSRTVTSILCADFQVKLGHTALTLAADSGHASVVRLLCENGANHEEMLVDGRTALHLAKQKDRRSVIDALHIVQLTEAANKAGTGGEIFTFDSTVVCK